ncbi:MAG TPA: efflux RND transporter permease subunit [Gammaproteobacteria bacterium]|nr:efflux RND transporter permease subunit [Gammaproteobacteria bacterium]
MKFTDLFIRRPVLATVVSLLILLLGIRAWQELEIQQFPEIENTQISISTFYPGASAELIQGFITSPIQQAVSAVEGIEYITSTSRQSTSTVTVHLKLNYDRNAALTEIMAKVNEVRGQLPPAAESPIIQSSDTRGAAIMYISFYSDVMNEQQVTDYLVRVVQPKLQVIEGVSQAQILGARTFAMRIWLDPIKLAAHEVTPADVARALQTNNYLASVGETKGQYVSININAATDLNSPEGFGNIVIREDDNTLVRIEDVANVELGAETYNSSTRFSGQKAVFIAIQPTPDANPLETVDRVREVMPTVIENLPPGLHSEIVYDATEYISDSIGEVLTTIVEAGLIVILVIYLFLGQVRAVTIPVITIPLSLIGVMFLMLILGYSINLLTLLAMVLAIGLVVDDAIVVVENVHRHLEEGKSPFQASLIGAREIAGPVIAMSITLAAVYAPIGFLGGLTGNLFREFAFTLASAVVISGLLALTLSPMMCSKILTNVENEGKFAHWLDKQFEKLKNAYRNYLHGSLNHRGLVVTVAIVALLNCFLFYVMSQKELAPAEDQGFVFVSATGPQTATHEYMEQYAEQLDKIFQSVPELEAYFMINGMGTVNNLIAGLKLVPWGERERSQAAVQQAVQQKLNSVAGLQAVAINFPSLPGSSGLPVQFVVTTTNSYEELFKVSQELMQAARESGMFFYLDSDLTFDNPQYAIQVNRNKAAELGISMQDIGASLSVLMSGGYINRFNLEGRAYKVIPQVKDEFRMDEDQLKNYYVRAENGDMIPLSTLITITRDIAPNALHQFQQLNSVTIMGVMQPGKLGATLNMLQTKAAEILPDGYYVNYAGQSRQFIQEGSGLLYTFAFALIIIFLVLAAQFESFRDPLIILVAVPLSIFGALLPIFLGIATINIYTQIGLVTLIGLISKHGILMVEFANKLQENEGVQRREAIEQAASIRLRPILMTTAAIVLGVLPLVLASGAGAASRFNIGLVVMTGMSIGTLFTLFVVPAIYTMLARDHQKQQVENV